jgi:hypothetical protein
MSASEKLQEEYEAVAEALVAEALDGFEKYLTPEALEITREALLTELLCTDVGRLRLAGCLQPKEGKSMESSDVAVIGRAPSQAKKAKSKKGSRT